MRRSVLQKKMHIYNSDILKLQVYDFTKATYFLAFKGKDSLISKRTE